MILLKAMLKFEILSMLFLSMFLLRNLLLFPLHYETAYSIFSICRTYAFISFLFGIHLNLRMDSILFGVRGCIYPFSVDFFISIVFAALHTSIPNLIVNAALPSDFYCNDYLTHDKYWTDK